MRDNLHCDPPQDYTPPPPMDKLVAQRIRASIQRHGGILRAAYRLRVDKSYFSRVRTGKQAPGPEFLDALGLETHTIIRPKRAKYVTRPKPRKRPRRSRHAQ